MNLYQETKKLMRQYEITAKKDLGQNFLIDEEVIHDIIHSADIKKEDLVIEIGPGLGTLTEKLLENAGKVVCIELDKDMLTILRQRFQAEKKIEMIHADILKFNLKEKIKEEKENKEIKNIKIVANLPYYITTPIIMKLLEEKLDIQSITVMIQKEVADRLSEIPGGKHTGAITYTMYYYAITSKVRTVPHTSFIPEPDVESEVIHIQLRNSPAVKVQDEKKFFEIIKYAFMQRRKTLLNALGNANIIEKEKLKNILKEMNLNEKVRGENLSIEQYAELVNKLETID